MRHRARTPLAILSLLLCVLCVIACLVSFFVPAGIANVRHFRDSTGEMWGYSTTSVGINNGRAFLHRLVFTRTDPSVQFSGRPGLQIGTSIGSERFMETWLPYKHESQPFELGSPSTPVKLGTFDDTQWTVPLWLLVPLLAILPIRWLMYRRREKLRNAAAVCIQCGYDLRASRGRCPECGEPIRARPEVA